MSVTPAKTFRLSRPLTGLLLLVCLSACGYRLAGTVELPPQLANIELQTNDFKETQRKELSRSLEAAGANLVENADADAMRLTVTLISPSDQQLATSASSGSVVRRVTRRLTYTLHTPDGEVVSPAQTLSQQVDLNLSNDSLLASSQERDDAIRELERALYQSLVLQLTRI